MEITGHLVPSLITDTAVMTGAFDMTHHDDMGMTVTPDQVIKNTAYEGVEFGDINDLYQILTEELVNPMELTKDIGLYLECDEDDDDDEGIELPNTNTNRKSVTPPSNNQPRTVDIPAGKRSVYRLSFPQTDNSSSRVNTNDTDRYSCDLCPKSFSRKTLVLDHKASTHHLTNLFPCPMCKYNGQRYRHWRKHISRMHPGITVADIKHTDGKQAITEQNGGDIRGDNDPKCKRKSSGRKKQSARDPDNGNNRCPVCLKCFEKKRSLLYHKRIHTATREHSCVLPECSKTFKTASALNEHKIKVHGPKVFACNKDGCTKAYAAYRYLEQHMKLHAQSFKCTAPNCGKVFRDKYNLDIHCRVHTGEKKLKCSLCDYACIQRNSLNWHIKSKHK